MRLVKFGRQVGRIVEKSTLCREASFVIFEKLPGADGSGLFGEQLTFEYMAKTKEPLVETEETEEEYSLIYNMYVTTMNITVESGGTVILQTGRPKDPVPAHGGG